MLKNKKKETNEQTCKCLPEINKTGSRNRRQKLMKTLLSLTCNCWNTAGKPGICSSIILQLKSMDLPI